jgi:hypothetical protein
VLWLCALVASAALVFRRVLAAGAAAIALLLFVVDDGHALATIWIANRNALVAGTLSTLGLLLHLRWRESGDRWAAPASAACFAGALLAGEAALGGVAYLFAYELLSAKGSASSRLRAAAPVVCITAGWLAVYKWLGYGAASSTMYVDPFAQPSEWLANAVLRVPVLLGALTVGLPADAWTVSAQARGILAVAGLLGTGAVAMVVRSAWPTLDSDMRRHVKWLAAGAALAVLPVTSIFPSSRLLVLPSLGSAAVLAIVLQHLWRERGLNAKRFALSSFGALLVLFHGVLAPASWLGFTFLLKAGEARADRIQTALHEELDPATVPLQRVVTLWSDPFGFMTTGAQWRLRTGVDPRAWWVLSTAPGDQVFTRTGPGTLELELAQGRLLQSDTETGFRPPTRALGLGDRITLGTGLSVDIIAADAQGIQRVRFTFDAPLEDPSLVLLEWREGVLRRLTPPAIGTRWTLTPPPLL